MTRITSLSSDDRIAVIGAGMCRTATNSLKIALETLYGQPCYHMFEIVINHKDHIARWLKIYRLVSEYPNGSIPPDLVHAIFKGYRCVTDLPACTIYKQLMDIYPESKVILTERDSESWIESVRTTVMPRKPQFSESFVGQMVQWTLYGGRFQKLCTQGMQLAMGREVDLSDDRQLAAAFNRRNKEVKLNVPPERLLVFNPHEGWGPLCQFLDLPIPNVPFPHVNEREELRRMIQKTKRLGVVLYWVIYSVFGFLVAFMGYYLFF